MAKRNGKSRPYHRKRDRAPAAAVAVTPIEYNSLQAAYEFFNRELFAGKLPDVFITLQRRANSKGHFSPDRYSGRGIKLDRHELALNPDAFIARSDKEIVSTLVHEQCHVWQKAFGKYSPRGYHNKQWAEKMQEVGLQPSSTGMVDGRETGQHMTHYIIPGGAFEQGYKKLAATKWKLKLQSAHHPGDDRGRNSKTKFTCAKCRQNAWGKPDLAILCKPCRREMRSRRTAVRQVAA
jgi:predicted SprT family Zn-dependent metalloprotease